MNKFVRQALLIAGAAMAVAFIMSCSEEEIEPLAPVTLTQPNGGETFRIGDTISIRWSADAARMPAAVLEITFDRGTQWFIVNDMDAIGKDDPRWGMYVWPIPDFLVSPATGDPVATPVSQECLIRVRDYNFPVEDVSDGFFAVRNR